MSKSRSVNVRLGETLSEFVAANVGGRGTFDNVSEYVRDLIRRDKERVEQLTFERLKTELQHAFAAPRENYRKVAAKDVFSRNSRG
ncbi:MAG TPA: addiction module antitoxin [Sphingomicrobium sp.]|nr:addiction module antitoxin [Sphingomicrobium sp.]